MEKNMSDIDGGVRVVLGIILALVYTGTLGISVTYPLSWVVLALAVVLLLTGIFGFCPLYKLLGISTAKNGGKAETEKKK
ncbi:MAG: DUF2892 domain-containing protein [Candidatus ainarchaeum sp.]|nr:DUF2892 domain-containing protein [Candidatus ainarchaeum sp.]